MKAEQRDYKQDYEDYWKDVVENDIGELNKDQVMRELSDYSILISSMSIILDHVTSGRISKPLTLPEIVCQVADESYDEGFSDERDEYEETIKSLDDSCASLRSQLAAMTAERDRLREALSNLEDEVLNKIDAWANAYPVDVFIEPTKKDWQKRNAVLKENGLSPDAFSGSNYRHCLSGMQGYAKRGMEIIAALESEDK